jgi:hypothetical protein
VAGEDQPQSKDPHRPGNPGPLGLRALLGNANDDGLLGNANDDEVVMDDFLYAEPAASVVAEPSSLTLLAVGGFVVAGCRCRRKRGE